MISTVYCVHGWSFDHHFWDDLRALMPDITFICSDRGYFGDEYAPDLPTEPYLAVGHSAGVLSLLGRDLAGCAGIVSFNGFTRFIAEPDNPDGIPLRFVSRMRARMLTAPDTVLTDFRTLCNSVAPWPPTPDPARLAAGLTELMTADGREAARNWGERLHFMAGEDDPLPVARKALSASGDIIPGGHLLPLQQPERCAAFLRSKLRHDV